MNSQMPLFASLNVACAVAYNGLYSLFPNTIHVFARATAKANAISFWIHISCVHRKDPFLWILNSQFWDSHLDPVPTWCIDCNSRHRLPLALHRLHSVLRDSHNYNRHKCEPTWSSWQRNRKRHIFQRLTNARWVWLTQLGTNTLTQKRNSHFSQRRPMAIPGCLRHITKSGWCFAMFIYVWTIKSMKNKGSDLWLCWWLSPLGVWGLFLEWDGKSTSLTSFPPVVRDRNSVSVVWTKITIERWQN